MNMTFERIDLKSPQVLNAEQWMTEHKQLRTVHQVFVINWLIDVEPVEFAICVQSVVVVLEQIEFISGQEDELSCTKFAHDVLEFL